jgi:hypothetical protein
MGTPGAWSTNDPTDDYYYALNTFGPHYWFFVMEMDCSQTQVQVQYFQATTSVEMPLFRG